MMQENGLSSKVNAPNNSKQIFKSEYSPFILGLAMKDLEYEHAGRGYVAYYKVIPLKAASTAQMISRIRCSSEKEQLHIVKTLYGFLSNTWLNNPFYQ